MSSRDQIKIIKQNNDVHWIFYISDSTLFYKKIQNSAVAEVKLIKEPVLYYDVDLDMEDNIHLIATLHSGEIMYFVYTKSGWKSTSLYKFNTSSQKYGPIAIKKIKHYLHVIYSAKNTFDASWFFAHHRWDGAQWEANTLLKLHSPDPYFDIASNYNNDIYIIFEDISSGITNGYFSSFHPHINKWSSPIQFASNILPHSSKMYIDNENTIHFLWQSHDGIYYKKKFQGGWPKNTWSDVKKITSYNKPCNPVIMKIRFSMWIVWIQENDLCCCMSSDMGTTWSNPFKYQAIDRDFYVARYIENSKSKFDARYVYGYENPNLNIAVVKDFFDDNNSKTGYFTFYIKELQNYTENLISAVKKMEKEKQDLKNAITTLQAEKSYADDALDKLNLELSAIKKQNEYIKEIYEKTQKELTQLQSENARLKELLDNLNDKKSKSILSKLVALLRSL
ncbi:hypothetical protein [Caldanaerobius polysaccharolyticus]|uniref:hypothetical protein n=1 Tax=Caldanaerobius polysaccharolyticus TaxID=44256 RepID=UPI0004787D0E|nr:hypothetical protein [Caldanaerobius polysaccharolyticus]